MNHSKSNQLLVRTEKFFANYWLPFGTLILFTGLFIFPSKSGYKTFTYLTFIAASFFLILLNFRTITYQYFNDKTILLTILALFYIAFSSLWSTQAEFIKYLKYTLILIVSAFGIFYLINFNYRAFEKICIISVIFVGLISLLWSLDFYLGNQYPFSHRFLNRAKIYTAFYSPNYYGSFSNSLLLSHVLTFFFTLGIYFFGAVKGFFIKPFYLLNLIFILILLIFSQTQMALITVSLVSLAHILNTKNNFFSNKLFICSVVLLALFSFIFALHFLGLKTGASYRIEIWQQSISLILDKLFFGHGLGEHPLITSKDGSSWIDTHNIYLAVMYYSGIFALLLILLSALSFFFFPTNVSFFTHLWFVQWLVYLVVVQQTDGAGLLARPSEHWFSLWIPLMFLLAHVRILRFSDTTSSHDLKINRLFS